MNDEDKTVTILGSEVKESELKASLLDVLKKRGLTGHLVVEREPPMSAPEVDYANVYKYAFF